MKRAKPTQSINLALSADLHLVQASLGFLVERAWLERLLSKDLAGLLLEKPAETVKLPKP